MTDQAGRMDDNLLDARRESSPQDWMAAEGGEESAPNPVKLILDFMHGRWLWALLLGLVLAPAFALAGYFFGPLKYDATAVLTVESRIEALVEETPETQEIKVEQEVAEQAMLVQNQAVLIQAFDDPALAAYEQSRPNCMLDIVENLKVQVPKRSALILVSMTDRDPIFAMVAVNTVVRTYMELFTEDPIVKHQAKIAKVQTMIDDSRVRIRNLKQQKIELTRTGSKFGIHGVDSLKSANVERIQRLLDEEMTVVNQIRAIRSLETGKARQEALARGEEFDPASQAPPEPDARVSPSMEELSFIDPEYPGLKTQVARTRIQYSLMKERFGVEHQEYRRVRAELGAQESSLENREIAVMAAWEAGPGKELNWSSLNLRQDEISEEIQELKNRNAELEADQIMADDIETSIASEQGELILLQDRRQDLDREANSIRQGRVEVKADAVPAVAASKDKKLIFAVGGAFGGLGLSFFVFCLVGAVNQKTFGVRQLEDPTNRLRVLGVMPNMDDVEEDSSMVNLATDCIHRVRGRIESRRAPEHGYAMMVSSPFQGDGKTTLAVSLGWSYAESGYKTLLLDADFIGRAMTHQFGHLKDPGLREIIRNGAVSDEIHELGHSNLCLLGVGSDRRISAANLSPRLFGRVLEAVRDRFDVIIVDSGPITASIEALPIASAVDGVVLALRRGRSRARLTECIKDVRSAGADYLGVVLNYADRTDCLRHGSTSRMSVSVQNALDGLEGESLPNPRNPMLGANITDKTI